MNAKDIQTLERMTFEQTGGGIHTLFTGTPDAEGYYEFAIGPFDADGEMVDNAVWVGHDGQSDEHKCDTLAEVSDAILRFREFDAEAVMPAVQLG